MDAPLGFSGNTGNAVDPEELFPPLIATGARFHAWDWTQKGGKRTKLPLKITAKGAVKAGSLDGCLPLAEALAHVAKALAAGAITGGLGVQLGRISADLVLAGIDIDECRGADGTIAPWALMIMARFPSARWEISPSGTGVKGFVLVLCQGELPPELHRGLEAKIHGQALPTGWPADTDRHESPGVGIAVHSRFYTVTAQTVPGHEGTWEPVPIEQVVALAIELAPSRALPIAANANAPDRPRVVAGGYAMTPDLLEAIESDPSLARRWFNLDDNPDRSGNDFRMAGDMAAAGYSAAGIEAALWAYPFGQIASGDLTEDAARRQVERCIEKALAREDARRAELAHIQPLLDNLRRKREARRAAQMPADSAEISPGEALERIRAAIEACLANEHAPDLGIRLTPGCGKTEAAINALPDGTTALFLVPTLKLAEEGAARARALGREAGVFYGKSQPDMCPKGAAATALGSLGLSSARFMCGRLFDKHGNDADHCEHREYCPWWAQHNDFSGRITFASANYFAYANDLWPEFDVIVIDEKFIGAITDSMAIDIDHIISPARFGKLGSKYDEADRLMTSRLLDLREIISAEESVWDYFSEEDLTDLASAQRSIIESLAPRPGCSAKEAQQAIDAIKAGRYHERATLLELLASGHGRPGFGERVTWHREPEPEAGEKAQKIKRKRLRLHIRKEQQVRGKRILITDADLDPIIARYIIHDMQMIEFNVRLNARIYQVPGSYTRKTLLSWYRHGDSDRPVLPKSWKAMDAALLARRRLERAIARICADGRRTLVVALRDLIEPDPERPPPPPGYEPLKLPECCEVAWFGSTLGLNAWAGCHRVIVIGQPNVPALEIESKTRALGGNWHGVEQSLPGRFESGSIRLTDRRGREVIAEVAVPVDEFVFAMRQQFEEAEVWQGANRGRFVHRVVRGEIVIFGKVELRQQPDVIVLPREVERPTKAALAIERFGVAPLSARELAEALGGKYDAARPRRRPERVVHSPYKDISSYKADVPPFPDPSTGPEEELETGEFAGNRPIFHGLAEELFGVLAPTRGGPMTMVSYRRGGQSGRGSPHRAAVRGSVDEAEALARLEGVFGAGSIYDVRMLGRFGAVSGSVRVSSVLRFMARAA